MEKLFNDEEVKSKSIIVDGALHTKFKTLCKGKSLKIGGVIEDLIKLYINDSKAIQKMVDELKEVN
jgi:glycerol-3-phosphate responsive antiterminator